MISCFFCFAKWLKYLQNRTFFLPLILELATVSYQPMILKHLTDCRQIPLLIPLKSTENLLFSDDFRGARSQLIKYIGVDTTIEEIITV